MVLLKGKLFWICRQLKGLLGVKIRGFKKKTNACFFEDYDCKFAAPFAGGLSY